MDLDTIERITPEIRTALIGRRFGHVFQMTKFDFVVDLRLDAGAYLFVSVSPANPRIYLIRRRLRDLERASLPPSAFANSLRKQLANAVVVAVTNAEGERVVEVKFEGEDELGSEVTRALVIQMTGRSANLFITDGAGMIVDRLRTTQGDGQEIGTNYSPPQRLTEGGRTAGTRPVFEGSISDEMDRQDLEKQATSLFNAAVSAARSRLAKRRLKLERRKDQLENDLTLHGDAEKWKRFGDVLLANVATAKRSNQTYVATDFFDEELPTVSIPYDNDESLIETAEKYFRRYTKARNAKAEVEARIKGTEAEIESVHKLGADLEQAIVDRDLDKIRDFLSDKKAAPETATKKRSISTDSIARSFVSSDGFEILVGKRAKDNDVLTFKIAKSLDVWMHAADYPGSHVVIRNPNRKEVPHRTLLEAAELAAFYSQGKAQVKAAVHYTQKKFVNKPKGAAAGLVSLASFKTLLVAPKVPDALDV